MRISRRPPFTYADTEFGRWRRRPERLDSEHDAAWGVVLVHRALRSMWVLPAALLLSACSVGLAGSSVAGNYTCTDSLLDSLTLGSGGKAQATATVLGETRRVEGTYDVRGDKVTLTVDVPTMPPQAVFTKSGNTLNGGPLGTCTKR